MPPHFALSVDEVLDEILRELTFHDKSFITINHQTRLVRRDLLAAALCCKAWKDKCLDHLWNRMSSLTPLLTLLPGIQRIEGKVGIIGRLDRTTFSMFDSYARRVVHLSFDTADLHEFDRATCINLSSLEGGLLPSLKTFKMRSGSRTSAFDQHSATLLLPSLVRSKELYSITRVDGYEGYGLGPTLSVLANSINTEVLRELSVHGKLSREYASLFLTMDHLRSVTIVLSTEGWEFELLETLSALQRLQNLDISFHPSQLNPSHNVPGTIPFSNLSKLVLTTTVELMLQILNSLCGEKLESLTLYPRGGLPGSPAQYRRLYDAIGRLVSLRDMAQTFSHMDHINPSGTRSAEEIMCLMSKLTRLESLRLWHIPPWLHLSDNDILTLVPAWPSLKKLILYRYVPATGQPTMASLCYLATACPELTQLLISVNTATLPPSLPTVSSHNLKELTILQVTSVDDPVQFARFIDGLFPNLLKLHMPAMSDKAILDQVCDIIFKACQPVRKDERERELALLRVTRRVR